MSGLTREEAYASVQGAAMRCWHGGDDFADELLKEAVVAPNVTREKLLELMDPASYLTHVHEIYARCGIKIKKPKPAKAPAKKKR